MSNRDYLTTRKPLSALVIFVIPMIIGNLFQQLYSSVDAAVVGRYVSEQALAAVGACTSFTNMFIYVAVGGGIGASVIVARHFGSHQYKEMKLAIFTAIFSFLFISIGLGVFGLVFGRPLMMALKTPSDVIDMSMTYLNIYFIGLPFLFMYNIFSSLFNALGRSKIPLLFLICSSLLNIGLDILFVTKLGMGVEGVAWATMISQGISAVLSLIVFLRLIRSLNTEKTAFFSTAKFREMFRIAMPSIFQQLTIGVGMMLVQSVVNTFGSEVLAGFSAAMRVEWFCIVPMTNMGNALSAYSAQNIGAGKPDRIPQGLKAACVVIGICSIAIALALELAPHQLANIFLGSEGSQTAFAACEEYLRITGWFYFMMGFKNASDGILRGCGDMFHFTLANFANLGIRVVMAFTLAPTFGIKIVGYALILGWVANIAISFGRYMTGKWRYIYRGKTLAQSEAADG